MPLLTTCQCVHLCTIPVQWTETKSLHSRHPPSLGVHADMDLCAQWAPPNLASSRKKQCMFQGTDIRLKYSSAQNSRTTRLSSTKVATTCIMCKLTQLNLEHCLTSITQSPLRGPDDLSHMPPNSVVDAKNYGDQHQSSNEVEDRPVLHSSTHHPTQHMRALPNVVVSFLHL